MLYIPNEIMGILICVLLQLTCVPPQPVSAEPSRRALCSRRQARSQRQPWLTSAQADPANARIPRVSPMAFPERGTRGALTLQGLWEQSPGNPDELEDPVLPRRQGPPRLQARHRLAVHLSATAQQIPQILWASKGGFSDPESYLMFTRKKQLLLAVPIKFLVKINTLLI